MTGRWWWQKSERLYWDSTVSQPGAEQTRPASAVFGRRDLPLGREAFRMSDIVRLRRLHRSGPNGASANTDLIADTHRAIEKVTSDIERFSFNTAVPVLMMLTMFAIMAKVWEMAWRARLVSY